MVTISPPLGPSRDEALEVMSGVAQSVETDERALVECIDPVCRGLASVGHRRTTVAGRSGLGRSGLVVVDVEASVEAGLGVGQRRTGGLVPDRVVPMLSVQCLVARQRVDQDKQRRLLRLAVDGVGELAIPRSWSGVLDGVHRAVALGLGHPWSDHPVPLESFAQRVSLHKGGRHIGFHPAASGVRGTGGRGHDDRSGSAGGCEGPSPGAHAQPSVTLRLRNTKYPTARNSAVQTAETASPCQNGAEYEGLSNRPRHAFIGVLSRLWRTVSHALRNVYIWKTRPTTTGITTPRTLLRVRIETQSAMAAKPMTGGRTLSQLATTIQSPWPGVSSPLPTSTKDCAPTVVSPASSELAPSSRTSALVAMNAA